MTYYITAAERIIDELAIASIEDLQLLEEIAWARGALVRYINLSGAEARLMTVGKSAIITISSSIKDTHRQRFNIAHEIGHLEMHRHKTSLNICTTEQINSLCLNKSSLRNIDDTEHEANYFASELLLPKRFFTPLCIDRDPSFDLIASLANEFNTSLTATAIRYVHLSEEPVAIVYSEGNRIKWFQGSKCFEEIREELNFFIDVHSQLDTSAQAAILFRNGIIPPGIKPVKATAWFTPGNFDENATIYEHSISMPNYNAVLSLLWINEDIENDEDWDLD